MRTCNNPTSPHLPPTTKPFFGDVGILKEILIMIGIFKSQITKP
jgi:hypothetical protein